MKLFGRIKKQDWSQNSSYLHASRFKLIMEHPYKFNFPLGSIWPIKQSYIYMTF